LPRYRPRYCCGKVEQSVMICGDIQPLTSVKLEKWLLKETPVPFTHIRKDIGLGYGFIHFNNIILSSKFFNWAKDRKLQFSSRNIRFLPSFYFGTRRRVNYLTPESINNIISKNIVRDNTATIIDPVDRNDFELREKDQDIRDRDRDRDVLDCDRDRDVLDCDRDRDRDRDVLDCDRDRDRDHDVLDCERDRERDRDIHGYKRD
ncbi:6497_t:CDS:2, partial [Funneliformis geosporum]